MKRVGNIIYDYDENMATYSKFITGKGYTLLEDVMTTYNTETMLYDSVASGNINIDYDSYERLQLITESWDCMQ